MKMIVDVSKWQGKIDWKKAAAQVEMAILRAGCGMMEDGRFQENCDGCRKNGVPFGTYYYITAADAAQARNQARKYWEIAGKEKPLFYAADVEDGRTLSGRTDEIVWAFARELRALGAEKIGLYVGMYVYPGLKKCPGEFDFLWVPRYGKNDGKIVPPSVSCDLHQYTSHGRVDGIGTDVDLNRLCGEVDLNWFTRKKGKRVRVAREGTWFVRSGNGMEFEALGCARQGEEMPFVARAENGWLCGLYGEGLLGWVSPACAEVTGK